MIFVKLDESNIEKYIEYLEHALAVEPEQMHVDKIDKEGLRERIKDSFFRISFLWLYAGWLSYGLY